METSETYIPSNSPSTSIESVVDTLRGGFKPDPNHNSGRKISSLIKNDFGLVRAAEEACKNADVQKDVNHLETELAKGNDNPGISRKVICNGNDQDPFVKGVCFLFVNILFFWKPVYRLY